MAKKWSGPTLNLDLDAPAEGVKDFLIYRRDHIDRLITNNRDEFRAVVRPQQKELF